MAGIPQRLKARHPWVCPAKSLEDDIMREIESEIEGEDGIDSIGLTQRIVEAVAWWNCQATPEAGGLDDAHQDKTELACSDIAQKVSDGALEQISVTRRRADGNSHVWSIALDGRRHAIGEPQARELLDLLRNKTLRADSPLS